MGLSGACGQLEGCRVLSVWVSWAVFPAAPTLTGYASAWPPGVTVGTSATPGSADLGSGHWVLTDEHTFYSKVSEMFVLHLDDLGLDFQKSSTSNSSHVGP